MRKLILIALAARVTLQPLAGPQGTRPHTAATPTATVQVVAYDANGRYLGAPNVTAFINTAEKEDLASKFHGGVAEAVPYGVYQVAGKQPWYYSDETYVRVYQPSVMIVLGLRFASELPEVPPTLTGSVVGLKGPRNRAFAKLTGLYENISMESPVGSDGSFTLGGLTPGDYLLLIVDDHGIMASRALKIPFTGQRLEIQVGTNLVNHSK